MLVQSSVLLCFLQRSSVDRVLDHLNSISPSITFTVEEETEGRLPFLDSLVTRERDGTLKVGVYRKDTHTDRYLPFDSHHPTHVKRGVVRSLVRRAEDVSTDDCVLKKEMGHLRKVLAANGYPSNLVQPTSNRSEEDARKNEDDEEDKPIATAIIPYSKGLSEEIRRVLRRFRIKTAFRSGLSLGRLLTKVKDPSPIEDRSGAVYKIKCLCGDYYIGETGRSTNIRIKEHKAACRLAKFERSAVAEHAWKDGHVIEWDQVEVLDTATDERQRRVKEALYIRMAPPGVRMNRDEGRDVSPLWLNAIRKMGDRLRGRQQKKSAREPPMIGSPTRTHQPNPPATPPPRYRRPTPNIRTRRTSHATPDLTGLA